jgi:hypothetical protein
VGVLGFEKVFENGSPVGFMVLKEGRAEIHLSRTPGHKPSTTNVMHIYVSDVAALYAICESKGVRIIKRLADKDYGQRAFVFADRMETASTWASPRTDARRNGSMTVPVSSAKCPDQRLALVAGLAVAAFHLLFAGRYDLFRDELYFIVCGQRPAFGYVDQPPGVPLLAAGLFKLGWGAFGLRVPTALAGGRWYGWRCASRGCWAGEAGTGDGRPGLRPRAHAHGHRCHAQHLGVRAAGLDGACPSAGQSRSRGG